MDLENKNQLSQQDQPEEKNIGSNEELIFIKTCQKEKNQDMFSLICLILIIFMFILIFYFV